MSGRYGTRLFGGFVYHLLGHYALKREAIAEAKAERKRGNLARMTNAGGMGWAVWWRRG